jgi:hypothetical protein
VERIHEFLEPQLSWRFPTGSCLCSSVGGPVHRHRTNRTRYQHHRHRIRKVTRRTGVALGSSPGIVVGVLLSFVAVSCDPYVGLGAKQSVSQERQGENPEPATFTGTPWSDVLLGSESRRCLWGKHIRSAS